jgi:hypothetical protein
MQTNALRKQENWVIKVEYCRPSFYCPKPWSGYTADLSGIFASRLKISDSIRSADPKPMI